METLTDVDTYYPQLQDVNAARSKIKEVCEITPLQYNLNLSERYNANIFLKREDLQLVRSYKIRGAYNKISNLSAAEKSKGVICSSAGNHAQGVAYSCNKLKINALIYMPITTPKQKISQVKLFGKEYIEIILKGDSYDESYKLAKEEAREKEMIFIHPFDDPKIIEGQATIAFEMLEQSKDFVDMVLVPVGGGGLAAGMGSILKEISPQTKIVGIEPEGAPTMYQSIKNDKKVVINEIDLFTDGAAVHEVGNLTFELCNQILSSVKLVPEGLICSTILKMYNEEAIVVEPAGALSIAALELMKEEIQGKNVVCIVSGSNNDILRTEEIKERSLLYEGLKHYFIVSFPQRAGALKEFANNVLNEGDDITFFEYAKKHNRTKGPALIGIEVKKKDDYKALIENLDRLGFDYEYINDKPQLFQYLI